MRKLITSSIYKGFRQETSIISSTQGRYATPYPQAYGVGCPKGNKMAIGCPLCGWDTP
jgi:hypothetical protein